MIFVFQLPFDRFFIYSYSQSNKTDSQILLIAELYYDYLKKYKPISIIKKYDTYDILDIDKYVKLYMMIYGVDYVRGGSYLDENISLNQKQLLLCELETVIINIDKKNKREEILSTLIEKYANNQIEKDEIILERNTLTKRLEIFKKEKQEYKSLRINGSCIIEHIRWILFACSQMVEIYNSKTQNTFLSNAIKKEVSEKYKKALVSLNTIYTICKKQDCIPPIINDTELCLYLKYPQLLLDDFFYHLHRVHISKYTTQVQELCSSYEYMTNIIINKMDEKAFDVSTWGEDFEWKTLRTLYLLDKIDS